jgi:hypothetical protein
MPHVLVRDLPEPVHRRLAQKAARSGTSLQQYLTGALTELADQPTVDDILDRIDERSGGRVGLRTAPSDLDEARGARP